MGGELEAFSIFDNVFRITKSAQQPTLLYTQPL